MVTIKNWDSIEAIKQGITDVIAEHPGLETVLLPCEEGIVGRHKKYVVASRFSFEQSRAKALGNVVEVGNVTYCLYYVQYCNEAEDYSINTTKSLDYVTEISADTELVASITQCFYIQSGACEELLGFEKYLEYFEKLKTEESGRLDVRIGQEYGDFVKAYVVIADYDKFFNSIEFVNGVKYVTYTEYGTGKLAAYTNKAKQIVKKYKNFAVYGVARTGEAFEQIADETLIAVNGNNLSFASLAEATGLITSVVNDEMNKE